MTKASRFACYGKLSRFDLSCVNIPKRIPKPKTRRFHYESRRILAQKIIDYLSFFRFIQVLREEPFPT